MINTAEATQSSPANLLIALTKLGALLGQERVLRESAALAPYTADTGSRTQIVSAAVFPHNAVEVQGIVSIAATHGIPLYPVSGGRNWGYGSACPSSAHNVVVDLSRMNKILGIDPVLGVAVVEPGVTQLDLSVYLEQHAPHLFSDVTGSAPTASVIANTLERGYGFTHYADHFQSFAGLEVVLPNGELLATGFGQFENSRSTYLHKWGVGPFLDGLFSQSNLGIVTKMGVWLLPKPQHLGALNLNFSDDRSLIRSIDAIREIKMEGYLEGSLHIANEMRVLCSFQQFPFSAGDSGPALSAASRASLMRKWKIHAWNGIGGMWGRKEIIKPELRYIKKRLGKHASVRFISAGLARSAGRFPRLYQYVMGHRIEPRLALFDLLLGRPNEGPMLGTYWMKREPAPETNRNPVRDKCGVAWCSPVVPLTADCMAEFLRLSREMHAKFGFDFNTTVSVPTERTAVCTVGLFFDPQNTRQTEAADRCYETLVNGYFAAGFTPYRASSDPAKAAFLQNRNPAAADFLGRLKAAVDPGGIIAPGRYGLG
ncbi:MAG: FAD-binding oxidoreductase [Oligoflexia bacterium]|nr:FAD-binding oxidoreductase [Oligoflexia bacterium]